MPYQLKALFPDYTSLSGAPVLLSDEEYARFVEELKAYAESREGAARVGYYTTVEGETLILPFAALPSLRILECPARFGPTTVRERLARHRNLRRQAFVQIDDIELQGEPPK